jgi:DNA replication protein DnaC
MFSAAQLFAASVNYTRPYWLTLSGRSGCGKTHLARAVWKQFMDQNRFDVSFDQGNQRVYGGSGMFVKWREFCAIIRAGGYGLIDDVCQEWFVIIDDLGSERDNSGFIAEAIDRIFAARIGKWTMITTNLTLKDISEKIDVRVADRMLRDNGVIVETNCQSWALRNFSQN